MNDKLPIAEFGAAFFGAVAAFALEAARRWREEHRKDLRTGYDAIFVLAQMYSILQNLNQQAIVDRAAFVRERLGREPKYLEYIPMDIPWNPQAALPMAGLSFLLESHDPDILNRLAHIERAFLGVLQLNLKRSQVHVQFQERARSSLGPNETIIPSELEAKVGMDLVLQLQQLTAAMLSDVPRTRDDLLCMGNQMSAVLKLEYPFSRIVRFTPFDKPPEGMRPPTNIRRVALWKRAVMNYNRKRP